MPFQRFLHLVVEEAVKEGEKDSLSRRLFSVMEENGRSEFFLITDFVVKSK